MRPLVSGLLSTVLVLAGVQVSSPPASAQVSETSATAVVSTTGYAGERAALQKAWAADFARLQKTLSGPAGVSVLPVGAAETTGTITVGSWRSGVAWSTSKVPLSVAALRASNTSTTRALVHRAITVSDNAAAERLWSRLGSGTKAGKAVQKVVRDAGDDDTVIQTKRVRAGFTPFGQTVWAIDDQARFAAGLSCLASAKRVISEMGHITTSQRWGLGHVGHTAFKGGWGPVKTGYLVRQVGIVTLADGSRVGVAIAVYSPKGFTRGTKDLTKVANWLGSRIGQVDGGRCPKK